MAFEETIGHQKQKDFFLRATANQKLAHAYVLVGTEHIGKTTFALELARILGADPVFDISLFDGQELSIEEARLLSGRLSLTPARKYKVAIVAHAETMTLPAANSLLKTLEETPEHSLIFLVTSNFHALLPTIASRVQRINFSRLSVEEIRTSFEPFHLPAEKKEFIISIASGRIGLAKMLATDENLYQSYMEAQNYFQVLEKGTTLERLQKSQELSGKENDEITRFIKLAMELWVARSGKQKLGQKLLETWNGWQMNLNTKLLLDNLFL